MHDRDLRNAENPRYLSIRYEALLMSPENTVRKVFDFLEIPRSNSVLDILQRCSAYSFKMG